jgi:molybdopterin synthase catalytic subunit
LSRLKAKGQFSEQLERMANPVYEVLLTKERLEAPKQLVDLASGAIVDFWGVVRELEDGRQIDGIEYEAHWAMAEHQLNKVVERAISDFALELVIIHHRVGFVGAGESSLFVRVAGQHRSEAFNASQSIVDELKKRVPIWKHPRFTIDNRSAEKSRRTGETASTSLRI